MKNFRKIVAQLDSDTIRATACSYLVSDGVRCEACSKHRKVLTALLYRKRKESFVSKSHPSSCVPYQHLSDSDKISRLRNVHEILRSSQSQVAYLQRKLQVKLDERSVAVDCSLHEDLCRVMQEETGRITAQYESGSFERLLWEHQERAVKTAPQSEMASCINQMVSISPSFV